MKNKLSTSVAKKNYKKATEYANKSEIFSEKKYVSEIFSKFFFFTIFKKKSWNCGEFRNLRAERESRNSGDHELWNHECGDPLYY